MFVHSFMVFGRKSDLWLSNSSSGGTDCYFSPLPVYWKKSMLEGGSWILFLFLTITPQPKVVNGKEKKHKRSQISYQCRNKEKLFRKNRHGHGYVSLRSFFAYFSHWDDQDDQKNIFNHIFIIFIIFRSQWSISCVQLPFSWTVMTCGSMPDFHDLASMSMLELAQD
jgi:hypothetical protein